MMDVEKREETEKDEKRREKLRKERKEKRSKKFEKKREVTDTNQHVDHHLTVKLEGGEKDRTTSLKSGKQTNTERIKDRDPMSVTINMQNFERVAQKHSETVKLQTSWCRDTESKIIFGQKKKIFETSAQGERIRGTGLPPDTEKFKKMIKISEEKTERDCKSESGGGQNHQKWKNQNKVEMNLKGENSPREKGQFLTKLREGATRGIKKACVTSQKL